MPTTADIKARLDDYLTTKKLNEVARSKIESLWPDEAQPLEGAELLDRLAASLARYSPVKRMCLTRSLPSAPSASTRAPLQYCSSLLGAKLIAVKFTALGGDVIGQDQCEKLTELHHEH